jgi:hypothetical protein
MARSRQDLGSNRFGLVDDLSFFSFAKMISVSQPIVGLGWRIAHHAFPAFD